MQYSNITLSLLILLIYTQPNINILSSRISCFELNENIVKNKRTQKPDSMVFIKGGTFEMGSKDGGMMGEGFIHTVELSDFYISKYEVTNLEYAKFLNAYGSNLVKSGAYQGEKMIYEYKWGLKKEGSKWIPESGYENHPVVYVTWYGAIEYCKYYGGRLPTEAEWEYVARGGQQMKGYKYAGSDNLEEVAWYKNNSKTVGIEDKNYGSHAIGGKKENELELYDMSGNVYEWCADWYLPDYYSNSPQTNPKGPEKSSHVVIRGGSWQEIDWYCRNAIRSNYKPSRYRNDLGFRMASEL